MEIFNTAQAYSDQAWLNIKATLWQLTYRPLGLVHNILRRDRKSM